MGILQDVEDGCAQYGVTLVEAFLHAQKYRSTPIVRARWLVFQKLRDRGWSAKAIGDALGMHHTTVLEAFSKMKKEAEAEVRDVSAIINANSIYVAPKPGNEQNEKSPELRWGGTATRGEGDTLIPTGDEQEKLREEP